MKIPLSLVNIYYWKYKPQKLYTIQKESDVCDIYIWCSSNTFLGFESERESKEGEKERIIEVKRIYAHWNYSTP